MRAVVSSLLTRSMSRVMRERLAKFRRGDGFALKNQVILPSFQYARTHRSLVMYHSCACRELFPRFPFCGRCLLIRTGVVNIAGGSRALEIGFSQLLAFQHHSSGSEVCQERVQHHGWPRSCMQVSVYVPWIAPKLSNRA